eukprot:768807-Hanusia_phi.AAC.9
MFLGMPKLSALLQKSASWWRTNMVTAVQVKCVKTHLTSQRLPRSMPTLAPFSSHTRNSKGVPRRVQCFVLAGRRETRLLGKNDYVWPSELRSSLYSREYYLVEFVYQLTSSPGDQIGTHGSIIPSSLIWYEVVSLSRRCIGRLQLRGEVKAKPGREQEDRGGRGREEEGRLMGLLAGDGGFDPAEIHYRKGDSRMSTPMSSRPDTPSSFR